MVFDITQERRGDRAQRTCIASFQSRVMMLVPCLHAAVSHPSAPNQRSDLDLARRLHFLAGVVSSLEIPACYCLALGGYITSKVWL